MERLLAALLFAATLVCGFIFVMGQDFKSLKDKAERAVKSRRPDWTIKRKDETDKQVIYNWNTQRDGVRLLIFQGDSEQEAAERMQRTIKFLAVGPDKKRSDLGDEAYSWKNERSRFCWCPV